MPLKLFSVKDNSRDNLRVIVVAFATAMIGDEESMMQAMALSQTRKVSIIQDKNLCKCRLDLIDSFPEP